GAEAPAVSVGQGVYVGIFRAFQFRKMWLAVEMTFGAEGLFRTFLCGGLGHDPVEIRNVVVRRANSRSGSSHVRSG
ncbi:hypothetical protein AB4212_60695, partial [Streptomyces sp. 2MCAF27]